MNEFIFVLKVIVFNIRTNVKRTFFLGLGKQSTKKLIRIFRVAERKLFLCYFSSLLLRRQAVSKLIEGQTSHLHSLTFSLFAVSCWRNRLQWSGIAAPSCPKDLGLSRLLLPHPSLQRICSVIRVDKHKQFIWQHNGIFEVDIFTTLT